MTDDDHIKPLEAETLLNRAGRKAWSNKFTLEGIAAALFDDSAVALSELERALMDNALRSLVRDIEERIIVELSKRKDSPRQLSKQLGHEAPPSPDNGGGHAYSILEKTGLLRATRLIEPIKHRMQTHRLTGAIRRIRRESSIASLMEDSQSSIIQSLLISPPPESVDRLKGFLDAESHRVDTFRYPLIRPVDLPRDVMTRLCWWISAALRHYAMANFSGVMGTVERNLELATLTVLKSLNGESSPMSEAGGVIEILIASGRFSPELMLQLLRQGEVSLFEAGLASLTGLRASLVARLLYESGGESLAVACKATGFDSATFTTIFSYTRHARLATDADQAGDEEIRKFYDSLDKDAAVAVLERWRRDADFLYAIKQLEEKE